MSSFNTPEELINYLDHNTESLHSVYTGERGAFVLHKYMEATNINRVIFDGKYSHGGLSIPIKTGVTLSIDQNADDRLLDSEPHDNGGLKESYNYYVISRPLKMKNP